MDDLISRQAAIDALVKWTHLTWEHLKIIYPMLNVLEKLPSAETELPFEIQDILDYLDTVLHPIISPEYWNVYSELYDMISTLPPADLRGRWIPVTERLPEESGEYLVAIGSMLYFSWFYKNDGVWSFMNADVTAWMPLPEPYKGGEEE